MYLINAMCMYVLNVFYAEHFAPKINRPMMAQSMNSPSVDLQGKPQSAEEAMDLDEGL